MTTDTRPSPAGLPPADLQPGDELPMVQRAGSRRPDRRGRLGRGTAASMRVVPPAALVLPLVVVWLRAGAAG